AVAVAVTTGEDGGGVAAGGAVADGLAEAEAAGDGGSSQPVIVAVERAREAATSAACARFQFIGRDGTGTHGRQEEDRDGDGRFERDRRGSRASVRGRRV